MPLTSRLPAPKFFIRNSPAVRNDEAVRSGKPGKAFGTSLLNLFHLLTAATARVLIAALAGCGALGHFDFAATLPIGTAVAFAF